MKQLKELHQFDIVLGGDIRDWVDVKTMTPKIEMPEQQAESAILKEVPRYLKAKNLGEKFAREITD